jgi:hypothetical protein
MVQYYKALISMAKELDIMIENMADNQEFRVSKLILHFSNSYPVPALAVIRRLRIHKIAGTISQIKNTDIWVKNPKKLYNAPIPVCPSPNS